MNADPTLRAIVTNFSNLNIATQMQDVYAQVESIIVQWAGAAGISATNRGDHVDARHLAVLEDITDRPFSQPLPNSTLRTPNPGPNVEGMLGNAYAQFANEIMVRLLVQGPLSTVFENARYDYSSDKLILNNTLDIVIARATANAPTGSALNIQAYWNEIARVVTTYSSELQTTAASAQIAVNAAAGFLTSIISVFGGSASDYLGSDGGGNNPWDGTRDVFWGGAGNDTLRGGHGSDVYLFGRNEGNDVIGEYLSHAFSEIPDAIVFRDGILPADVTLTKSGSWDLLISISGSSQTILVKDYYVTEYHRIEEIRFSNGVVWGASTIHGLANNTLTAPTVVNGTTGNDTFTPTTAQAAIITGTGADTLVLNASSSAFISISDFNYAQGDRINITAFNGQITKLADLNIMNVLGRAQFTLPGGKLVVLSGVDARLIDTSWFISGTLLNTGATLLGTSGNDVLQTFGGNDSINGGDGNDTIDGGLGSDTMVGGLGDDAYFVNVATDVVTESANQGMDSIFSAVTYTLGLNVENLTLTGSSNINGTGNTLNNVITGNAGNNSIGGGDGNDTIDGGLGNDTLVGGLGNDTFIVNVATDVVTESASQGTDVVLSSASYTLGLNVENLTLTGSSNINGTGNTLNNIITGNGGNNTIDGGLGNDTMIGGIGNDTYVVNVATDVVTEIANQGTDIVLSAVTYTLAANVENLTLTGSAIINGTGNTLNNVILGNTGNNSISGGDGNDTIDGGLGNDTMLGGLGDDTFIVNIATDVVTESASQGTDSVFSAVTYTLGLNIENLTLTGTAAINGTGNTLNNILTGNADANTLNGGTGNDTMVGGAGNDIYVVDAIGDLVTEDASAGTDTIQSSVTYTASANIENLTLTGTAAINSTGNTLNNILTGNSGANVLSGGAGSDTLIGGAGADTFVISNSATSATINDFVVGTDKIDLRAFAGVTSLSNLVITQVGANTTLSNSGVTITLLGVTATALTANDFILNAAAGGVINGTAGNDSLVGTTTADTINALAGNDTITGNAGDDVLNGGSGDDLIFGGDGNDVIEGGLGSDLIDGGAGNDTTSYSTSTAWVNVDLSINNQWNGDAAWDNIMNVENIIGSAFNDQLIGDAGANQISGGLGVDTITGNAGDDVLNGNNGDDLILVVMGTTSSKVVKAPT
jgi:Hemolysin-type calcium-binding repeat (2 copies)./Haemolysin-type calcium binding protein related domain.